MFGHSKGGVLFLKSLDIAGFKSFSRGTRFEFAPGITALIGPNGSGKSNVVDAIRWCLGEQSVRDLRGQRAEDVIYAGARQVLGAAEVSLTFSPAREEAPTLSDVTVARRLFRSGESEYLLDGRKVRLRDLTDRVRAIGIDGSRHIVVTQGMADALLSASPTERRSLLEHAAGLSGYRVRRDEARHKLGTTEQNIATIGLVLDEMEPRLRSLRRQARAVQERESAAELLLTRLHDWYASRWQIAMSEADAKEQRAVRHARERASSEEQLAALENAAEHSLRAEREWQASVDALVAANRQLERERDTAERARTKNEQSLLAVDRQLESTDARAQRATVAEQEAVRRIDQIEQTLTIARADTERLLLQMTDTTDRFDRESTLLGGAQAAFGDIQREVNERERSMQVMIRQGETLRGSLEATERRTAEVNRWLESALNAVKADDVEREMLVARLAECTSQVERLETQLQSAEDAGNEWRMRTTRLDILIARTRAATSDAQRRHDSGVKTLDGLGVADGNSLIESISVTRGWEAAVAAGLGTWARVGASASAQRLHEDLSSRFDAWRAGLDGAVRPGVWGDSVVRGMPAGRVNPLKTCVLAETDAEAARIWAAVRGLSAHTIGTPGIRVITRAGTCWNAVGRETSSGDDRAARYLRLKREVATLAAKLAILSQRGARLGNARAKAVDALAQHERVIESARADLRLARAGALEAQACLASSVRKRADTEARIASLRAELDHLADARRTQAADHARWAESKSRAEQAIRTVHQTYHDRVAQVETLRSATVELDIARREARQAYEIATAHERTYKNLHDAALTERARLQRELAAGVAERSELEKARGSLRSEAAELQREAERCTRLLEEHSLRVACERAQRPDSGSSSDDLRQVRARVNALVRDHERAQAEHLAAQERLTALAAQIHEDLELSPDELRPSGDPPPSELEVRRLRSRASQFADAEPAVIEEARELAERHEYLTKHLEDLKAAAETLRTMMDIADAEMREQFDLAFGAVNEEFSRVFEVMLRGGRARLESVEGGGIEVVAQLPGKRTRSSAAFSGGERSLIASSLLFGVLKMRPAPFCVLDEVDAALDEGNVDRYLEALRDISRRTQAIVVTHNRATMAAADVLYGMTMDADGASGVLSLRFDSQAAG